MARSGDARARDWNPPRQAADGPRAAQGAPSRKAGHDGEGSFDPLASGRPDKAASRGRGKSANRRGKSAPDDVPPWEDSANALDGRPEAVDVPDWNAEKKPGSGGKLKPQADDGPLGGGEADEKASVNKDRRAAAKAADIPDWDAAPKSRAKGGRAKRAKTADSGAPSGEAPAPPGQASGGRSASGASASARNGAAQSRARRSLRDDRLTLTVQVSGEAGDQFDVLADGRAYWGGYEPPYKFEMKLEPGPHDIRVRQRHAMDKQPSEFVPLPLAILLGDGCRAETGPYYAALDVHVNMASDSRLTVKYALAGRAGRSNGQAAFSCSAGKGLECEVVDTSMSSTPRLRRRWCAANYATLIVIALMALSVVGLGAYLCVKPGGSLGGGIAVSAIGAALSLGCVGIAGAVRTALDGGYAPDMDFPKPRRSRASGKAKQHAPGDETQDAPGDAAAAKPARKKSERASGEKQAARDEERDYDGAYDDAGEMDDFEEAGLSAAELSPEQLRAAKRQLIKKLGGDDSE